jgi:ATP-dependent RNA helicase DDX21
VRSAAGGGFQAEKLREVRALSSLFPSSDDQRAEVSAGAVATTDYGIARGRGGRQFPFGYSQGSDSEEEEEDEEAEVLLVDKNVKDPGSQLDIASLGLPQPVVDALAKRGISQLFPIQVTSQYIWKKRGEKIARVGI